MPDGSPRYLVRFAERELGLDLIDRIDGSATQLLDASELYGSHDMRARLVVSFDPITKRLWWTDWRSSGAEQVTRWLSPSGETGEVDDRRLVGRDGTIVEDLGIGGPEPEECTNAIGVTHPGAERMVHQLDIADLGYSGCIRAETISPDGRWVSVLDYCACDVFSVGLLHTATGEFTWLARHGQSPVWLGEDITFTGSELGRLNAVAVTYRPDLDEPRLLDSTALRGDVRLLDHDPSTGWSIRARTVPRDAVDCPAEPGPGEPCSDGWWERWDTDYPESTTCIVELVGPGDETIELARSEEWCARWRLPPASWAVSFSESG